MQRGRRRAPALFAAGLAAAALAAAGVLAAGLAGCAPSADVAVLDTEGARALLLVEVSASGAVQLTAIALGDPPSRVVSVPTGEAPVTRWALLYDCGLEALGLAPGPVQVANGPGRPLPTGARVRELALFASTWSVVQDPPALASVALATSTPPEGPCLGFDTVSFAVPGSADQPVSMLVPLGGDEVLLGTAGDRFFRGSRAGLEPLPDLAPGTPRFGGFQGDGGELWLIASDGTTRHGDLARGLVRGNMLPDAQLGCLFTARSPLDQPLEVFVLTCYRRVWRFDGALWSAVDAAGGTLFSEAAITWVSPGVALAAGPDAPGVTWYEDGVRRAERLELEGDEEIISVARSPELGLFAGTSRGNLHRRVDGVWLPAASALTQRSVRAIYPIPGGVIFGGTAGVFTQVQDGHGRCESRVQIPGGYQYGVSLERSIAIVGRATYDALTFVTPVPRLEAAHCPLASSARSP